MLKLKNISKKYITGDFIQYALNDLSISFRESEFVSILGPSGSGKTTLLNIIGGLDRYDNGDLIVNDISTKKYKDRDWDSYRNHSIGFVFQNYNLIPHLSILSNVELSLTISGVSKSQRNKRAKKALEDVGLTEHINKKPNQLSGGQMQRVAIARALINNPNIILADEPTGALDSKTSIQIMELLKDLSKDKLVIVVTHNPELAQTYSTRIINLKDGSITSDTNPFDIEDSQYKHKNLGKASMNFFTALSLSFNNLKTKLGRTFLTAFAGSIGIIGIALILSLSSGTNKYISKTEESTLSEYPLTIQDNNIDFSAILTAMMKINEPSNENKNTNKTTKKITVKPIITDLIEKISNDKNKNDMKKIKKWLDSNPSNINDLTTSIEYVYNSPLNIYISDTSKGIVRSNPSDIMDILCFDSNSQATQALSLGTSNSDIWLKAALKDDALKDQFDILEGKIPVSNDEAAIVVNSNGEISDYTLYSLGLKDKQLLKESVANVSFGKEVEIDDKDKAYSYKELLNLDYKMIPEAYKYSFENNLWVDKSDDETYMKNLIENGHKIKICGILKAKSNSQFYDSPWGFILYRQSLTDKLLELCNNSEICKYQTEHSDIDIFTNLPFTAYQNNNSFTMNDIEKYIQSVSSEEALQINTYLNSLKASGKSDDEIVEIFREQFTRNNQITTYESNIEKIGASDENKPNSINIYPIDFKAKEKIDDIIKKYNNKHKDDENQNQITYTDLVGSMMKSVTSIINAITYILIAFVAISLIVSSIMIGIITYISVLERTKEIGILRSLGASKRNISNVFNAETAIIGFFSGIMGVLLSFLLTLPINQIIYMFTKNENMKAILPLKGALILIVISTLLTMIGGLLPARKASKKDPVLALRTE